MSIKMFMVVVLFVLTNNTFAQEFRGFEEFDFLMFSNKKLPCFGEDFCFTWEIDEENQYAIYKYCDDNNNKWAEGPLYYKENIFGKVKWSVMGTWKFYDCNGNIFLIANFERNKKRGRPLYRIGTWVYFNEDKSINKITIYNEAKSIIPDEVIIVNGE